MTLPKENKTIFASRISFYCPVRPIWRNNFRMLTVAAPRRRDVQIQRKRVSDPAGFKLIWKQKMISSPLGKGINYGTLKRADSNYWWYCSSSGPRAFRLRQKRQTRSWPCSLPEAGPNILKRARFIVRRKSPSINCLIGALNIIGTSPNMPPVDVPLETPPDFFWPMQPKRWRSKIF